MKTYKVMLVRSNYVEVVVEANSRDEAESLAWIEQDRNPQEWVIGDEWETLEIDQLFAREEA
jgi:hypothetical protein